MTDTAPALDTSVRYYASIARADTPAGRVPTTLFTVCGNTVTGSELIGPLWQQRGMPAPLAVFLATIRPGGAQVVDCTRDAYEHWWALWDRACNPNPNSKPEPEKANPLPETLTACQKLLRAKLAELDAYKQKHWDLRCEHAELVLSTREEACVRATVTSTMQELATIKERFNETEQAELWEKTQVLVGARFRRMSRTIGDLTAELAQSKKTTEHAVTYLREARNKLSPHIVNRDVDDFIQRNTP